MNISTFQCSFILATMLSNAVLFACLQAAVIRLFRPRRLLLISLLTFAGSTMLLLAMERAGFAQLFETREAFVNFGLIVACGSLGLCGLYTFLGPATADRSATAHMLIWLLRNQEPIQLETLRCAFDADAFINKRLAECRGAQIVNIDSKSVHLTRKGRALARALVWISNLLQISRLRGFVLLFHGRA
jgi:hypothetical protein